MSLLQLLVTSSAKKSTAAFPVVAVELLRFLSLPNTRSAIRHRNMQKHVSRLIDLVNQIERLGLSQDIQNQVNTLKDILTSLST